MPGFTSSRATAVFRGAREANRLGPVCGHSAFRQQRNQVSKTSANEWLLANAGVAVVQSKAQAAVSKRLSTVRRARRFLAQSIVVEAVAKTGLLRSLVIVVSSVVAAQD